MKKELVNPKEIDDCLRYISDTTNSSAQDRLLKLLREIQISLDEPKVEDSIDGTRIRITYTTTAIRRKGEEKVESVIRFQYIKEIPVDYSSVPIRLRGNLTTPSESAVEDGASHNNANPEDIIIGSYDEIESGIPTLREVLGLLKRIYFMPEDFSNKVIVDRIHKLRNMFSKDEILTFPTIDPNDKAGLIPI